MNVQNCKYIFFVGKNYILLIFIQKITCPCFHYSIYFLSNTEIKYVEVIFGEFQNLSCPFLNEETKQIKQIVEKKSKLLFS